MFVQDPAGKGTDFRGRCLVHGEPRSIDLAFIKTAQDAHEIRIRHRQPGKMLLEERAACPCGGGERGHDYYSDAFDGVHGFLLPLIRPLARDAEAISTMTLC